MQVWSLGPGVVGHGALWLVVPFSKRAQTWLLLYHCHEALGRDKLRKKGDCGLLGVQSMFYLAAMEQNFMGAGGCLNHEILLA